MILARLIQSIIENRSATAAIERQITTGERYQALSEAPVAMRSVLTLDSNLRANDQYLRNIEAARSRLSVEDSTLQNITNLLARAREVAIQQGGDTASSQARLGAQREIQELRATVIQAANQQVSGAYVFGGANSDRAPLDPTGALDPTNPARGAPQYELGPNSLGYAAHDAGEIFIDTDVIGALDALDAALGADDKSAIHATADRLRAAIGSVQTLVAETGSRQVRLDVAQDAQALLSQGLRERRSTLMDTSLETAVTELASLQSSYQASLLATSRLLDTSLVNFLR